MLSVIGGLLLVVAGASGAIGVLGDFLGAVRQLLGDEAALSVQIVLGTLSVLTVIGGIGVVVSGFLLTTPRVRTGRTFLLLFVGMAVLGLFMALVQLVATGTLTMDLVVQLGQSLGWIGAILGIVARIIAEQYPLRPRE